VVGEVARAVRSTELRGGISRVSGNVLVRVASIGACAVRDRSRGRVLGLYDACRRGGAHSSSGRRVLVLGRGADVERRAGMIVELAVMLAGVLVRGAGSQGRAHPVRRRRGCC
jgi:hypothetical protein